MKHRGETRDCENSKDIHVIVTAFPQPHPAATIPLADPGPAILRGDLFDPNEDCAKGKICVGYFATHSDDAITVCAGVLVEEISESIKLFLDGLPGLLSLCRSKLGGRLMCLRSHKMGSAALRESEMSHGDHDRKEGFCEDFVYVVNEEALESARSFGKDRSSGVRIFEVFSYVVGVGERFPTAGIVDNRESVNWPAVGTIRSRGNVQLTKNVLNLGRFDPVRTIWKTFVIENKSMHDGHYAVHDE